MGSIELNVKDAEGWHGGRNDAYMRAIEGKMGALDAKDIADRAIEGARPSVTDRAREALGQMADSAQRVTARFRQETEKQREAAEVFGESVTKRYLVVNEERNKVALYEQGSKTPAITIDKHKISTQHDGGVAVQDAVKLAIDRGWTSLKIEGTQEFKDAVWLEAKKYDLKVGHKPSDVVRAEFDKWRESNELRPLPASSIDKPAQRQAESQQRPSSAEEAPQRDLAREFVSKTPEQRLKDPDLRNAELTAQAAKRLAGEKFGVNDPRLKVALAKVDKLVSDQLGQGHKFTTPKMVTQTIAQPKPENKQQFDRPRI